MNHRALSISFALMLISVLSLPVSASFSFSITGASGVSWSVIPVPDSDKVDIVITKVVPPPPGLVGDTILRVRASGGDPIRNFIVRNLTINQLQLEITGNTGTAQNAPTSIDAITMIENEGLILYRLVFVNGDLGSVLANRWFGGVVTGDVLGPMVMVDYGGTTGQPPGIFEGFGDFVIEGGMRGDLIIEGTIRNQIRVNGKLGLPSAPVLVAVRDQVRRIEAGEINATFVNNLGTGPVPVIASLATSIANGESGEFNGLIYAENIESFFGQSPEFEFAGDMNGDIWIGNSLDTGVSIAVPSGGLKGQVIIGTDITPGTADCDGEVTVDTADLSPVPFYANLPSAIGGGAVGLVPFSNHGPASTPPAQTNVTLANTPGPTNPIILEHYGQVFFDEHPDTEPVLVFIEPCGSTNAAVPIECYTTEPDPTNPRALIVTLNKPVPNGWRVRIKPSLTTTGDYTELESAVDGTPFWPIADYEYNITVGTCPSDFNADGVIDADDLGILLAAFGNSATGCAYQVGDINGDGTVDADDLGIMLAAFGGACDACSFSEAFSMMSGTTGTPWIIESIGFQSVEEFMAAFVNLNEQEQLNIVDLMLELIN